MGGRGPHLARALAAVVVTWVAAVVGVVLAVVRGDWLVAAYAVNAAICAAGWAMGVERWQWWREICLGMIATAEREDP